jgi:hypothetical protein
MPILTDPEKIKLYQMRTQLSALYLEIQGLKSRGGSMYTFLKNKYSIKGSRIKVYKEFHKIILQREKELGIPERELNNSEKSILG